MTPTKTRFVRPVPLEYAAMPQHVECSRDGALVNAVVPRPAEPIQIVRRLLVPQYCKTCAVVLVVALPLLVFLDGFSLADSVTLAVLICSANLVAFATFSTLALRWATDLRAHRIGLSHDELVVSDVKDGRERRWPRSKIAGFEVHRLRRSRVGQLRMLLRAKKQVGVSFADADDLDVVAKEMNAALELPTEEISHR